ncbi:MAG: MerR family transcriptional regulator [Desulfovibrionaceae bacterium]|nr:MerR family transcriptional regulator [Desulfovibrionaceae bacterium]MBF0513212.1 MerR family transcriptional regulator [Desulfovibrionaceae bacterium]
MNDASGIEKAPLGAFPVKSELISFTQIVEFTGVHPSRLGELIEFGFVSPSTTVEGALLFRSRDVYRLRKLERLARDFDLPLHGVGIIVELLERIEDLETKVRELERLR